MFGLDQILKNMLDEMGLDLPALQNQAIEAYHTARDHSQRLIQSQQEMVGLLRVLYNLQKDNAEKLDAIMNHFDISLTKTEVSHAFVKQLGIGIDESGNEPEPESGKPN